MGLGQPGCDGQDHLGPARSIQWYEQALVAQIFRYRTRSIGAHDQSRGTPSLKDLLHGRTDIPIAEALVVLAVTAEDHQIDALVVRKFKYLIDEMPFEHVFFNREVMLF